MKAQDNPTNRKIPPATPSPPANQAPEEEVRDIPAINLIRTGWTGLMRVLKEQADPPEK